MPIVSPLASGTSCSHQMRPLAGSSDVTPAGCQTITTAARPRRWSRSATSSPPPSSYRAPRLGARRLVERHDHGVGFAPSAAIIGPRARGESRTSGSRRSAVFSGVSPTVTMSPGTLPPTVSTRSLLQPSAAKWGQIHVFLRWAGDDRVSPASRPAISTSASQRSHRVSRHPTRRIALATPGGATP